MSRLSPTELAMVKRIAFNARRAIRSPLIGAYRSSTRGTGLEFSGLRPYVPGDEIRHIDWKTTARKGQTFVRQYEEERQLTINLLLDISRSTSFGSARGTKRANASFLCAVLVLVAERNRDKTGLMLFTDRVESHLPARSHRSHLHHVILEILSFEPKGTHTRLDQVLQSLMNTTKPGGIVVLVSDFIQPIEEYDLILRAASKRFDIIAIQMVDDLETYWPEVGLVRIQDIEDQSTAWVDGKSDAWHRAFTSMAAVQQRDLQNLLQGLGIASVQLTHRDEVGSRLLELFRLRLARKPVR
jgi:uncharacterized protein (DUF58 family)